MSWLLFLDESGHDHRNTPYEVRGGVAFHARDLWPFVQDLQRLELDAFGAILSQFRKEIKGRTLLNRDRFRWAAQAARMDDEARRKHCRGFLTRGLERKPPTRVEFTAYGQACLEWARGMFELIHSRRGVLFATAVPCSVRKPPTHTAEEFFCKDHVFLLERFFYFLEGRKEHGLLVMDEVDKTEDRRFVRRLEAYFRKTQRGRYRTQWIVPTPFFVASDLTYPVQVADVCVYCVNWGFRLPLRGMNAATRGEIEGEFRPWLDRLQFRGKCEQDGVVRDTFGIVYVPDPYEVRRAQQERR